MFFAVASAFEPGRCVTSNATADFRSRKLFDFGFSDPSKVEVKGATYTKDGDKWKAGGKVMDNTSVQNLIDKLRDLTATKFAAQAIRDCRLETR